jgi:cytochrome o ubiquinol oxidase subunit 2
MRNHHRQLMFIGLPILAVLIVVAVTYKVSGGQIAILSPAGTIAAQQRRLLGIAFGMMLLIVIPVFILTFYIAWKYRAGNTKANYQPEWDGSRKLELTWWGLPFAIIFILAVIAWNTSHSLDPSVAISSTQKPYVVQVVSLQWKWLFLYPEDHVASVNYVTFPAGRPIDFEITSDAPMNSFWIPRLGGQIYAMSGMATRLYLQSDAPGSYHGSSANVSGSGFSAMNFTAEARSQQSFDSWITSAKASPNDLSLAAYVALSRPTVIEKPLNYSGYEPGLFQTIIAKYNEPGALRTSSADTSLRSQETR